MKYLLLCMLILLSVSCREEIQGWDKLSQAERDAMNLRAQNRCLSTSVTAYKNFQEESDEVYSSAGYNRGLGYLHEYKLDAAVVSTVELRVWKQDPTHGVIYFYVTETTSAGTSSSYFLRVKRSQNEEMIGQFKIDQCGKFYTSATTGESGPLSVTLSYTSPVASGSKEYTDVYTFHFAKLAFLGGHHFSRKIIEKDSAGTQTSSKSYTSTFNPKTYPSAFPSNNYADSTYYTQSYCELAYHSGDTVFRLYRDEQGFTNMTCVTTMPTTPGDEWDMTI